MPFTPFHFGPGFFIKSITPRNFSFLIFILSQVLIDIETLFNIIDGEEKLHTFFHTYLGSLLIIVPCVLIAETYRWAFVRFRLGESRESFILPASMKVVALSAFIGAWSHVFLDSIMHSDITPLAPFTETNHILGLVSYEVLHMGCALLGLIGIVIYFIKPRRFMVISPKA